VGFRGDADQRHGAVKLEEIKKRIKVVLDRHGIDDEIEAACMGSHLFCIAGYNDFIRTQIECILSLASGGSESYNFGAPGVRQLDAHMTETANTHNSDFFSGTRMPMA
jgi:hypothetical protein